MARGKVEFDQSGTAASSVSEVGVLLVVVEEVTATTEALAKVEGREQV